MKWSGAGRCPSGGTDSSNPSPSSTEAGANPTSVSLRDRDVLKVGRRAVAQRHRRIFGRLGMPARHGAHWLALPGFPTLSVLSGLQPVQRDADASVEAALASSTADEREANLNLAESLNGLAIDGYLSVAQKYTAAGCQDRARWIYSEIKRVYTGDLFLAARNEADQRLLELQANATRPENYASSPVPIARATTATGIPEPTVLPDTRRHPQWVVSTFGYTSGSPRLIYPIAPRQ